VKKPGLFILLYVPLIMQGQYSEQSISLLIRMDSAANAKSVTRYFAGLYRNTTFSAVDYFSRYDDQVQSFMQRLEKRFAGYFFEAAIAYEKHAEIPLNWKNYFKEQDLSEIQYLFLGANAHINGDIWQALVSEFSLEEIEQNKKAFFAYENTLADQFQYLYKLAKDNVSKIRLLHSLTLGFDKVYGVLMLHRWRKRQMELAILFYTNKTRFTKKLNILRRKMSNIDQMILREL